MCRQQNMHEHVQAYPGNSETSHVLSIIKFILKQIAILYYGNWYSSHYMDRTIYSAMASAVPAIP